MGREAIDLYRLSASGDMDAARILQYRLLELDRAIHGIGTSVAALKAAMNLRGRPGGYPRRPILPLTDAEMTQLKTVMQRMKLL